MTNPNNAKTRTREFGSLFRFDPDVWKPITPLAVVFGLVSAIGVFVAMLFVSNWLYAAYSGNDGTEPNVSVISAIGTACMAFMTALHSRPMGWRAGILACAAAALVVGAVVCTAIAAAALIVVSGSVENVNTALPYAVLISGIPGLPAMLGAIFLLGRWPAAPPPSAIAPPQSSGTP